MTEATKTGRGLVALIPAGGFGGSMQPITAVTPKCLSHVGSMTLLERSIRLAVEAGATTVVVSAGYLWPMVAAKVVSLSKLAEFAAIEFRFLSDPDSTIHTGGSFRRVANDATTDVAVVYPDVVLFDTQPFFDMVGAFARRIRADAALGALLTSSFRPLAEGIVVPGEHGQIVEFVEKPTSTGLRFNMALAVFDPRLADHVVDDRESLFGVTVPRAVAAGENLSFSTCDREKGWAHVQTFADLHRVHHDVLEREADEIRLALDAAGIPCEDV